jgi:hypothetical protein
MVLDVKFHSKRPWARVWSCPTVDSRFTAVLLSCCYNEFRVP